MFAAIQELYQRLDYLRDKIKQVENGINAYVQSDVDVQFSREPDDGGFNGASLALKSLPPISIRSDAGTIANELRSILDALACQLAEQHCDTSAGTYFPISKTQAVFETDGRKKMRRLSPDVQSKVATIAPWGGIGGHPWLFRLHEADRVRKHTGLLGFAGGGRVIRVGSGSIGSLIILPQHRQPAIKVGERVQILDGSRIQADIDVQVDLVYCEKGELFGLPVIELLFYGFASVRSIIRHLTDIRQA